MSLQELCPNLIAQMDEEVDELRDLVVVDENYDDIDSDEFDIFDPQEYNFLVYVTERVQQVLGEEKMASLAEKIASRGLFEEFYASEPDMYGVRAEGDEEEVARQIVRLIEEELMCSEAS